MSRPGHIQRTAPVNYQAQGLSEREQHVLREKLIDNATKERPDEVVAGPLFRVCTCMALAVAFGAGIWRAAEEAVAYEYFAAYTLELCLSTENLFAIFMVFRYFKVPPPLQEHVLWWGILGSAILRGTSIFAGGVAVLMLKEVMLMFAAVVIYSGFRLAASGTPDLTQTVPDNSTNGIIQFVQMLVPVTDYYDGAHFFSTKPDGSFAATPLLVVLLVVELTDFFFALDNIPALYGVAEHGDVFVVMCATFFAVICLRSAYSLLTKSLPTMPYLQKATGMVLIFVGIRSVCEYFGLHLPAGMSLLGIIGVLFVSAAVSMLVSAPGQPGRPSRSADPLPDMVFQDDVGSAPKPATKLPEAPHTVVDLSHVSAARSFTGPATTQHGIPQTQAPPMPKGKPRSVAADLIGSALEDPSGSQGQFRP